MHKSQFLKSDFDLNISNIESHTRKYQKHREAVDSVKPVLNLARIDEDVKHNLRHANLVRELSTYHHEKERIRAITHDNQKLINKIIDVQPRVDNRTPPRLAG